MIQKYKIIIIDLVLLSIVVFLFYFLGIRFCPFFYFFHVPCPGCGLTRSIVLLLQGDFVGSFQYHILGIPLVIAFAILLILFFLGKGEMIISFGKRYAKVIFVFCFLLMLVVEWHNLNNPLLY